VRAKLKADVGALQVDLPQVEMPTSWRPEFRKSQLRGAIMKKPFLVGILTETQ